jgi:DNA-binding winged helix-turn-helix (wHTH) protein
VTADTGQMAYRDPARPRGRSRPIDKDVDGPPPSGPHGAPTRGAIDVTTTPRAGVDAAARHAARAPGTQVRGFAVQVGLNESAAESAGTSLAWLAGQLRHYVESTVPGSLCAAVVAIAPAGAPGSDLEVVRRVLGVPAAGPDPLGVPGPDPAGLHIDLVRWEVRLDGEVLDLTHKELELLNHLVGHRGHTVGRAELLGSLWGHLEEVPNERTVDVHIRRLRTKLGRLRDTVQTVRGQGYRLREHPEVTVRPTPGHGGRAAPEPAP